MVTKRSASLTRAAQGLFASSRPLQSTLSIAQPLFGAFLATRGAFSVQTLLLILVGSAAGLYAVFALNDWLDRELDAKTVKTGRARGWDMDAVFARHPLTAGMVTRPQQLAWIALMTLIATGILLLLNPFALALFGLCIMLEFAYCRLALVTEYKTVVAGAVVAVGAMIGWFAAGGAVEIEPLIWMALAFFAWEVGGRNIPNDFSDVEQDRLLGIQTIPVVHGRERSAQLILAFGLVTLIANGVLAWRAQLGFVYLALSTLAGLVWLIQPALTLVSKPKSDVALAYFNKASLYPVFLWAVLAVTLVLHVP